MASYAARTAEPLAHRADLQAAKAAIDSTTLDGIAAPFDVASVVAEVE